ALARAQGVTEFARTNYVVVFRTVGGQQYAALYDLRAIRGGAYVDPEIYANDVVLVNESRGRRVFQSLVATSPLLSAPLIALLN
ncbi:MAG TPA: polysaccharide export protein, partial [Sphingomicrobium sp.]